MEKRKEQIKLPSKNKKVLVDNILITYLLLNNNDDD